MKFFTNRSITKKVLIVILTVMLLTFSVPKPVHAAGGILLGPITALCTTLVDSVQHILERFMLGEWNTFMKDVDDKDSYNSNPGGAANVNLDADGVKIGGAWWGDFTGTEIPVIQYTPEEIFANRVPALDVNFIKPSVTTPRGEEWDKEHNIAMKLQPVIASWYVAMRTLALVGLLSVLVYLGIRMLLTGVAADKAKYKKMLMDWLVAMCLLFALHYIMSFALTMSEVVTSMIANTATGSITVTFDGNTFTGNLMSYVRFMIQAEDTMTSLGFFFLYIMLMIYTVKFTWVYLKRVVNMAFLTLIAPLVAVTYPIDKVSDGKAQAFNLWIKEFAFNALLQPLHLLLYIVLLGSATELVAINPLYAVICLGFITAGEKLFKKMFGFDKASGGTLGSLAAAAGVSTLAHSALMKLGKGPHGGKGGPPGKVRTNDQREGKNPGANKGYNSFDKEGNQGINELEDNGNQEQLPSGNGEGQVPPPSGNGEGQNQPQGGDNDAPVPPPDGDNEQIQFAGQEEMDTLGREIDELEENGDAWSDPELRAQMEQKQARYAELEAEKKAQQNPAPQGNENVQQAMRNLGPEQPETWQETMDRINNELAQEKIDAAKRPTWRSMREADKQAKDQRKEQRSEEWSRKKRELGMAIGTQAGRKEIGRKLGVGAYKTIRGIKTAAPTALKNGARFVAKTGTRAAIGAALAATAGVIGATTGDGETALKWAAGGFGVGAATGGNLFEGTVGKVVKNDRTVRDSYGAGKYGSAIDARNAKADKQYLRSQEHDDEYEKYFKEGQYRMTKEEFTKATREYREVGITNKKDIRRALHLEAQYAKNGGDKKEIRGKVQNIVQTYDGVNKKAVYGENKEATEATLKNIESQLSNMKDGKQRRAVANEILQGYRDWYNTP
ncbi:MAG: hypothetical protein HFJ58_06040 [Clostridia bacterium]|nr:hypothetical protein [Clostridia bacterium]